MQLLGWGCASCGSISQARTSDQNETRIRYFTYHCLMQVLLQCCHSGVCGQVLGCAPGVIIQLQCVSFWFLLFQELGWSPCCDNAWYNFPGKSMQTTLKPLDPLDRFPFLGCTGWVLCKPGSVQMWPEAVWIQVPRTIVGCFGGANVIGVFICLFYLGNPEL